MCFFPLPAPVSWQSLSASALAGSFVFRVARFLLVAACGHGFGIEMEPFDGFQGRRVDAHVLHLGDEIEDIPAMLAFRKAVPNILADAHSKLRRIAASVDGARAVQAVGSTLELVHEAIMLKDLFHGDGRFDGPEVNEL